jgi:hypothetical protein
MYMNWNVKATIFWPITSYEIRGKQNVIAGVINRLSYTILIY